VEHWLQGGTRSLCESGARYVSMSDREGSGILCGTGDLALVNRFEPSSCAEGFKTIRRQNGKLPDATGSIQCGLCQ